MSTSTDNNSNRETLSHETNTPLHDIDTAPLAIITGGAGGIGLELGKRLLARGYRLLIVERESGAAERASNELGERSSPYACDLSDAAQVRKLCNEITDKYASSVAILACNAGVIIPSDVAATNEQAVDVQIDVMLKSVIQLIRAVLPCLIANDRGHILATVSIGGIYPMPGSATYSAAKAGLRAFLAATATELRDTNVHVGGIYPSAVDTPMLLEEARHGGSPLNFVGAVQSIKSVADAYERSIDKRKLEVYVPHMDGIMTRIVCAFPALLPRLYPMLARMGEKGQRKFLADTMDMPSTSAASHPPGKQ